ncbi:M56 family metallopeptidase [Mucilaginibacter angelicae]|uniref:M56 family metallopeptidase n=1 Tax=Mucilaginibacter angelicae TaxID=869718 RepID=A0ABV6L118_9SPHI
MEQRIQHIFPQNIAQALCHTLLHSLWEGLFLAILTGLIILLTRNSGSALRYRLLVGALLLYTAIVSLTLVWELNATAGESFGLAGLNPYEWPDFVTALIAQFNDVLKSAHEHAAMVSGIWLLVVGLQNVRLFFGLYAMERLKRVRVKPAGGHWQEKINRLGHALGISQAVLLLESAVAKVPMVIGYLKPVVLVPVGLVNSLEPAQVEAILLHELAHIRRKDYLVNILQTVLETFFFFNPAVLWLSWLIRLERENCCDDAVIHHTQNQIGYMQALVHFEEYRQGLPPQAVALTGRRGNMLGRLERILAGNNRSLGKLELIILAVILVLSTVFIAVSPQTPVQSLLKTQYPGTGSNSKNLEAKKKAEAAERTRHKEPGP